MARCGATGGGDVVAAELVGASEGGAAARVVTETLSVRDTERLVGTLINPAQRAARRAASSRDVDTVRLENDVAEKLGAKVRIEAGRKGAARVRDSLARMRGREWARARWRRLLLARDACDLHRERQLAALLRRAPWTGQELDPLWADAEVVDAADPGKEPR